MKAVNSEFRSLAPSRSGGKEGTAEPRRGIRRLHRVRTVRRQQNMSLRTAARQLDSNIRETRKLEDETADLRLSELYRWQKVLDVPLLELLVDPDTPLSRPVMERAQMVRVMKTAMAILEIAPTARLRRLAQMLAEQLIEVMPELRGVGPWHSVGQRRSLDEWGRIAEQTLPDDVLHTLPLDSSEG